MAIVQQDLSRTQAGEPTLAEKVAFLSQPAAYPRPVSEVIRRETHMSWVFLAGDKVYKLKKPVRFPYLDFSTLARREAACRAELDLNRRLAPDIYLDVRTACRCPQGLSIGAPGEVADWLVVMRRLEDRWALDRAIEENRVDACQLDRLVTVLGRFYRHRKATLRVPCRANVGMEAQHLQRLPRPARPAVRSARRAYQKHRARPAPLPPSAWRYLSPAGPRPPHCRWTRRPAPRAHLALRRRSRSSTAWNSIPG